MKNQPKLMWCAVAAIVLNILPFSNSIFAQGNFPSVLPDRIVLNPTSNPVTSLAITWRTDTNVKTGVCELQFASDTRINPENTRSYEAKTSKCRFGYENEPEVNVHQHSVVLRNLISGAKYIYRVGSGSNWSEWFEFKTPVLNQNGFSFIYFGDAQIGLRSEWSRVVRKAYQTTPDCLFMLYGGDIINRAGRDVEWQEWFEAGSYLFSMVPQIMTPGNHDYHDLTPDLHWNTQFTQPINGPAGLDGTCFFCGLPESQVNFNRLCCRFRT